MSFSTVSKLLQAQITTNENPYHRIERFDSPFGVCNPWPGLKQSGVRWCRCGGGATQIGSWNIAESQRGKYDFRSAEDEYTGWMQRDNLIPTPILCYTPAWATGKQPYNQHDPPADLFDYFHYVREMAKHFRGRIPSYEVWNEPNGRGAFFRGRAVELARMIKAAHLAIFLEDPHALTVGPGLAGCDVTYMRRLYELGIAPYFDCAAVHPYQFSIHFTPDYWVDSLPCSLRELMDSFGDDDKPIWFNEFGFEADNTDESRENQANALVQAVIHFLRLREIGVEKMFWYNSKDWGQRFGLFDKNGYVRPSLGAYGTLISQLEGLQYAGDLPSKDARLSLFVDPKRYGTKQPGPAVVTVEAYREGKVPCKIQVDQKTALAVDRDGKSQTLPVADGTVDLQASRRVQYVHVDAAKLKYCPKNKPPKKRGGRKWPEQVECFVWAQLQVPQCTQRAWLVRGKINKIPVEVYNFRSEPNSGEISVKLADITASAPFCLAPMSSTVVNVRLELPKTLETECYAIEISGNASSKSLAPYTDSIWVADGPVIDFTGNSWCEVDYLQNTPAGSPSTSFGGEILYRFDLSRAKAATLQGMIGANGGKLWVMEASKDGKKFEKLAEAQSWPRNIRQDLTSYVGAPVWIKIHGDDCIIKRVVLCSEDK